MDVDGLPTRYLTAGDDGPPLVLLHGVGDNALDWRWVTPALARSHRVYAPDLPGSGGSAKPQDADYSPGFFGRFVAAFLDALGIERASETGMKRSSPSDALNAEASNHGLGSDHLTHPSSPPFSIGSAR